MKIRSTLYTLLVVCMNNNLHAQVTVIPHNYCGPGGILETTISTDQYGRTIKTEKYFDGSNPRIMCEQIVTETKFDNSGTIETSTGYRKNGTVERITITEKNNDGSRKTEHKVVDEKGNVKEGSIAVDINGKTTYYNWDTLTKKFTGYEIISSINPKKENEQFACLPRFEFFAGYSYLRGDYGLDKESFPTGARLAAVYNLSNHIAVGIDASLNSRKIGTENLSRSFIMIEGKYVLGDMDDCNRNLFGNIRLLGGIGIEKYGSSSGSGPAFGAGAGVIHLITKKVAARVQVDHLSVKYKGAEKLNNNLRMTAGIVFRF